MLILKLNMSLKRYAGESYDGMFARIIVLILIFRKQILNIMYSKYTWHLVDTVTKKVLTTILGYLEFKIMIKYNKLLYEIY